MIWRKINKDYVQYFKAWNASFNFKGFNLDMNNDIEFECVPNALFKSYGNKRKYQINIYTQFIEVVKIM